MSESEEKGCCKPSSNDLFEWVVIYELAIIAFFLALIWINLEELQSEVPILEPENSKTES